MGNNTYIDYFVRALLVVDLLGLTIGFVVATTTALPNVGAESFNSFLALRLSIGNVLAFLGLLLVWTVISLSCGIVSLAALVRPASRMIDVLLMTILATLTVSFIAIVLKIEMVNLQFLGVFWATSIVVITIGRLIATSLYKRSFGSSTSRPTMLIVGINSRSIQFANDINAADPTSHRIVGFVDDKDYRTDEFDRSGYKLVTSIDDLQEYLRKSPIDEVLISLPMKSRYDDASKLVSICEEQGIKLRILADLFQYRMTHSRAEKFGRSSVITVAVHGMTGFPAFFKRALDIVASGAALVVMSPLFLLVAVLVKLDSPGEVFFAQERVGLNKKGFRMIKFRTMVVDAEERQAAIENLNEASGPAFKIKNDPRITTIGKILRRTSIDELPQLLNVFRGEMSLVGPRPLPLRDYSGFSEDWHRRRVSVRPGMTGLWQVESRDHSSFDKWMKLDMEYIDRWSIWLDIKIIIKTIPAMIRGSGD